MVKIIHIPELEIRNQCGYENLTLNVDYVTPHVGIVMDYLDAAVIVLDYADTMSMNIVIECAGKTELKGSGIIQ